jgi:hypothetical protein
MFPFNQRLAFLRLFQEPRDETQLWDQLNQDNPTLGFAGSNATAKAIPMANYSFQFPSYERLFEIVSNHVQLRSELTGNANTDKAKIFAALKQGQFYASLDLLADPKGFFCEIESDNQTYLMGSTIKWSKKLKLKVHLPAEPQSPYEVVVIRNGERYRTFNQPEVEVLLDEPGTYRVWVRVIPTFPLPDGKKWISWIYANPFFVK